MKQYSSSTNQYVARSVQLMQLKKYVLYRLTSISFRSIGSRANHSMLNKTKAKTCRCDDSRDESTTDAEIAALTESDDGNLPACFVGHYTVNVSFTRSERTV